MTKKPKKEKMSIYFYEYSRIIASIMTVVIVSKSALKDEDEKIIITRSKIEKRNHNSNENKKKVLYPTKDKYLDFTNKYHIKLFELYEKDFSLKEALEFIYKSGLLFLFTEFDNYLGKCFSFVLNKYPSKFEENKIKFQDITPNTTYDEIKELLIKKRIHDEFYNKYGKIFRNAEKFYGIKLSIPKEWLNDLEELKLIRDIYVHGDGRINEIFLKKSRYKEQYELGETITLSVGLLAGIRDNLNIIAKIFDRKFVESFPEVIDKKNRYYKDMLERFEVKSDYSKIKKKKIL